MSDLSRVVWSEGMYLAQHHFQVQSRYFEDSLQFALSHLCFKPYGLVAYELDAEALRNGTVSLIHARGVLPDGLPFHIPDSDPVPPARDIGDLFSPTHDSHLVLLAVPVYRRGGPNYGLPGGDGEPEMRYIQAAKTVLDDITGRDEQPVSVGRKNLRLRLDREAREGEVTLALARVRRDGSGHFIYDPEFVPPSLQIGASERLMLLLRRLVEILDVKSQALATDRPVDRRALREYAGHEVASFWLRHAIHSSLGPLRHHLEARQSHPERLYQELARLAGALCTFAMDAHPRSLPPYLHDNPEECFTALDRQIRTLLELVIPSAFISIPLRQASDFLYVGAVTDQRCFGQSHWILGVRSSLPRSDVISRVSSLVKICSSKYVERLYRSATPGLTLDHLPSPPSSVAPRIGTEYFSIGRSGTRQAQGCWDLIVKGREVGIYAPEALAEVELELLVVPEA